ncbi:calcium-binding protein [Nocardioides pakistanensis]
MKRSTAATAAGALVSGLLVAVAASSTPSTSSYLYDLETIKGELSAGTWQTTPAICDEILDKPHATVFTGTAGVDVLLAWQLEKKNGVYPQVILGLGGNDVLKGGNQNDCLVGGEGNDILGALGREHENGKDILLGGPGNDLLLSGNGKDYLDGGPGDCDICIGDNGKDTFHGCERIFDTNSLPFGLNLSNLEDQANLLLLLQSGEPESEKKPSITKSQSLQEEKLAPADTGDDSKVLAEPPEERTEETASADELVEDPESAEISTPEVQELESSEVTDTEPAPDEPTS